MSDSLFNSILAVLIIYLVINGAFFLVQESLLFFPNQTALNECALISKSNIEYYEDDDVRFIKAKHAVPKANLVLFHGNAGSACDREFYIDAFSSLPINVILAEYPGYSSNNQGRLSEKRILSNADKLISILEKEKIPLLLFGESLGTGPATYIASKYNVAGLLLTHPFTSITDVANSHYPFLLIGLLNRNRFNSEEWARSVSVSPIVFQGTNDDIIPLDIVEKQLKNFKEKPLFHKVDGAGHNDLLENSVVFEEARKYILDRL